MRAGRGASAAAGCAASPFWLGIRTSQRSGIPVADRVIQAVAFVTSRHAWFWSVAHCGVDACFGAQHGPGPALDQAGTGRMIANCAPKGSASTAKRPMPGMSVGGTKTRPPSPPAWRTLASASATAT